MLESTLSTHRSTLVTCLYHSFFVLCELVLVVLWAGALVTMMNSPKGKDYKLLFHKPPVKQWGFACALAFIEL